jgi:hypothetical protein
VVDRCNDGVGSSVSPAAVFSLQPAFCVRHRSVNRALTIGARRQSRRHLPSRTEPVGLGLVQSSVGVITSRANDGRSVPDKRGGSISSPGTRDQAQQATVRTTVPGRLDRLPWSRWHWMVLVGLGTVWILDGLEVTIVGAVGSTLTNAGSGITITTAQIGDAAGIYVFGACIRALLFGHLTDRLGRRKLFLVTLGLYLIATILTATSRDALMFFTFRFFTGMGIGGEYAAINSAIDELIPARVRGTVDLLVNGSYWLGTAAGAAATLVLLDPKLVALDLGWRTCFFMGAVLGLGVLLVRRHVPESPRWLFTHGQADEAERIVDEIARLNVRSGSQPASNSRTPVTPSRYTNDLQSGSSMWPGLSSATIRSARS